MGSFRLACSVALPYLVIAFIVLFLSGLSVSVWIRSPELVQVPPLQLSPDITAASSFNGTTVIIIGAGAAGLFAAYTLEYLGIDYLLLEANANHVGGRAQELNNFVDVPLDLGPEWIHVHPKIRQDLLLFDDKVTDEVFPYRPDTIRMYRNERLWRRNWMRWFYQEYKFRNTTWHSYLQTYVYPYVANRTVLHAEVVTIDSSSSDGVIVTARDGRMFQGDRVIVASPVSVLQQGDIQFVPEMPDEKRAALDRVDMSAGIKAWIEFDECFYPDWTMFTSSDEKLYLNAVFHKPTKRHVLLLFEVGPTAYSRIDLNDTMLLQSILDELDDIFDGKASAHYMQHRIQNWSKEPYIKGAYSFNSYPEEEAMMRPLYNNRVYFCGEYLGQTQHATVHGAALSGRRVAQQVLLDFQAQ
jgi:monoamine oxidase